MRAERKIQLEHEEREWSNHRSTHDRLLHEARRDMGVPYPGAPEVEAADRDPQIHDRSEERAGERDAALDLDAERDLIADEIALAGERPELDIFPANRYGNEIIDMSGPVEPETSFRPSYDEPPPLEPDDREPNFETDDD